MTKTMTKTLVAENNEAVVLTEEVEAQDGISRIGIMTLNSPQTMNAVDLSMVNMIDDILARWKSDENIVAIIMTGAGDRAFSAGGDIRQIYNSVMQEGDNHLKYADAFFTQEYSKNYRVHLVGKPLIAWGNGFVMGGGLGLFIGANHKVGTENLKLAWPEIRIGLFPDVVGTYYLSRLPFPIGHWMGLTGCQMNAVDCKDVGLTNYCIENDGLDFLIAELCHKPWQKNKAMNNQFVREVLTGLETQSSMEFPPSNIDKCREDINSIFDGLEIKDTASFESNKNDLVTIHNRFKAADIDESSCDESRIDKSWFTRGKETFLSGCPATAHLIMKQLQFGNKMTLKEVITWELGVALQSVRHPDFAEGVRSVVVDKDGLPKWQHDSVADVPEDWVDELLTPLWPREEHPFYNL